MTISAIISTYNNPAWLAKTLLGYRCQTRIPDEIIIADDGSTEETARLIESFSGLLPLRHVWHEDKGFRKTTILNKALLAATAEYLIFTDQDCVPRKDFVATHERLARPGHFLSGGYFKLTGEVSARITDEDIICGRAFDRRWLLEQGQPSTFKMLKLLRSKRFAAMMNTIIPTRATWNGMNSSGWRRDLLRAKGFDERMRYGGEDRELGERLVNAGITGIQVRYAAVCLHLHHDRPYVNATDLAANDAIRRATRQQRLTVTEHSCLSQPDDANSTPL